MEIMNKAKRLFQGKNVPQYLTTVAIVSLSALANMEAQTLSYNDCKDVSAADFKKVPLVTRAKHLIAEPIQMALPKDGRIFWVELGGKIRMWSPTNDKVAEVAQLPALVQSELGIVGIAMDPKFEANGWMYIFWATQSTKSLRLSRFTLKGSTFDLTTEKILLEIPLDNLQCCHTGGHMVFDLVGNLWLSVGNTTNNGIGNSVAFDRVNSTNYVFETDKKGDDQRGSANTNSLLGKILRIIPKPIPDNQAAPTPGVGKTYEIPEGNLFPKEKYPEKTRPEIYTMGHRNPYSIAVDPYRNWLMWGDIGPDEFSQDAKDLQTGEVILTEEHNLVTKPGFMGWPYFVGNNQWFRLKKDPKKPMNNSINNTGLTELPPAQSAIRPYKRSSAITGPIYYYNGANKSKTKLPPHFDRKWLFGNFGNGWLNVATVDALGTKIEKEVEFFKNDYLAKPLDIQVGPDDNLYVVEYAGFHSVSAQTAISRVEYTRGDCLPDAPLLPPNPTTALGKAFPGKFQTVGQLVLGGKTSLLDMHITPPDGSHNVQVFDIQGNQLWQAQSDMGWVNGLDIPSRNWTPGVYHVRYTN